LQRVGQALRKPVRLIPVPSTLLKAAAFMAGKSDIAQKLIGSLQVDASHTRKQLNWSPPISMSEGLSRVAAAKSAR